MDRANIDRDQLAIMVKNLTGELDSERRKSEDLRTKKEAFRTETTNQGQEEREALREAFAKEL